MKKGTSYPLFTRAGICRRHMSVTFVGDKQYLSAVYQSKHAERARSIAAPSEFFFGARVLYCSSPSSTQRNRKLIGTFVTSGGFEWGEQALHFRLRRSGNVSDANYICSKMRISRTKIKCFSLLGCVPHPLRSATLWSRPRR